MKFLVVCCAFLASGQFVAADDITDTMRKELDDIHKLSSRMSRVFDDIMKNIPPRRGEGGGFVPMLQFDPSQSKIVRPKPVVGPTEPEVGPTEPEAGPAMITSPELTVRWNRVTLTWDRLEGADGYEAELITEDGVLPAIRLRQFEPTFTTTDIKLYNWYSIRVTPIMIRGMGVAYTTEYFVVPGCPVGCPRIYRPVCGADGTTYGNRCELESVQCLLGDEGNTLAMDYEGECGDPCAFIACDPPQCPEGFVLGSEPLPEECCIGCVDECSLIECPELSCGLNGYTEDVEGECCPICIQLAEIGSPSLNVQWNEVTLTWDGTDDVIGYEVTLITEDGVRPTVQLGPSETSYTATGIQPYLLYSIHVTPITLRGEGVVYTTESFMPECPFNCTLIYTPLCGTDGRTYGNRCQLETAQCELGDREGNVLGLDYEGECDPCARIECDAPQCPLGFVLGNEPLPGECCVGCVDECSPVECPSIICQPGEVTRNFEGECCPRCAPTFFRDCTDAMAQGMTESREYTIHPEGMAMPVDVYCDMETDGGGWTVILRRVNSTVNFYRSFEDYVVGFGDLWGAHWVGLETLYRLGRQGNTLLLVAMTDRLGTSGTGKYTSFEISSREDDYRLESASGYSGDVGNALNFNRGAAFSARDLDNDNSDRDCADVLGGAWWYKGPMCSRCNPMGEYMVYPNFGYEKGVFWAPYRGKQHSMPFFEMKIRPAPFDENRGDT